MTFKELGYFINMKNSNINYLNWLLFGIIILHVFILSKLRFFPYPELFVYSYLTKNGLIPYSQIFDQHFPGVMFFPVNLATLGIDTIYEFRYLQLALVISTHVALFVVSKKLFRFGYMLLTSNILYLLLQPYYEGYVLWIDSFVPLLLLVSFYFLIRSLKKTNFLELFLSGLFIGLTILFKQVTLPFAFILWLFILFKYRNIKYLTSYSIGVITPLLVLALYIFSVGAMSDFIYWTITFNLTIFSEMGRKYASVHELIRLVPALIFGPLILMNLKYLKDAKLITILLFFLGGLFYIYARFDFVHFQPSLVFAILLITYVINLIDNKMKFMIICFYIAFIFILLLPFYKGQSGHDVYFFGNTETQIAKEIRQLSESQDRIFAFGTLPHIYYLADRMPAGNQFVFQFPWFMRIAESKILSGLLDDYPKVVIRDSNSTTAGINLLSYMPNIDNFINEKYKVVKTIDGIDLMLQK